MQLQRSDIALLEIRAELEKAKAIVERRREYSRRYYLKHKQTLKEKHAKWYRKNPEYLKEYMKCYRKARNNKVAALDQLLFLRDRNSLTFDKVKEILSLF